MAQTVGIVDSKDLTIYIGANAVGCATDAQIEFNQGTREIVCKDTAGWAEHKTGIKSWQGSGSGLFAFDATYGGVDVIDDLIAGTEVTLKFSNANSGDVEWSGTAIFTQVQLQSSGAGENVTYSFSFQGSGAPTKTTIT